MKKLILIFSLVIVLTGCEIERIDTSNKDELVSYMTNIDYELYNRFSIGYKYYLPKSVSVIEYEDYNEKLLSNGNIYYLYVDVTSYYYKKNLSIDKKNDDVYYKEIDNNGKKGYVKVTEEADGRYYVVYQYNYSKMEAIINKKSLDETLVNMSYITSSIKYNDSVIESLINNSHDISNEEAFELDKPNNNESTFLDYVKAYDKYNDDNEDVTDEETIKTDETEE